MSAMKGQPLARDKPECQGLRESEWQGSAKRGQNPKDHGLRKHAFEAREDENSSNFSTWVPKRISRGGNVASFLFAVLLYCGKKLPLGLENTRLMKVCFWLTYTSGSAKKTSVWYSKEIYCGQKKSCHLDLKIQDLSAGSRSQKCQFVSGLSISTTVWIDLKCSTHSFPQAN